MSRTLSRKRRLLGRRLGAFEVLEDRRLLAVDFGDAPDLGVGSAAGNYRTLSSDNGPRHTIVAGLHLGASVDGFDGGVLQNLAANADDVNGALPDDEDGVATPATDLVVTVGSAPTVSLWATNTNGVSATLYGWIDYDGDGEFDNASERASIVVPSGAGASIFTLAFPTVPEGFHGASYARFRLSTDAAAANSIGAAADGEVEDYRATVFAPGSGRVDDSKYREITSGVNGGPLLAEEGRFGASIVAIGDLDGDGTVDLAAGAPKDATAGVFNGAVYVLFMNGNGTVRETARFGHNFGGGPSVSRFAEFGTSLAALGDMDGDGVPDLAVGASEDSSVLNQRGAVYIVFMQRDGTAKSWQKIGGGTGGGPMLVQSSYFGRSLASLGDLDGDGITELAVGAPRDTIGEPNGGAVYVLFMNSDGTVKRSQAIASGVGGAPTLLSHSEFGSSVATLGDVDGDGVTDVVIGANGEDQFGDYSGAAFVMLLNRDGTVKKSQQIALGVPGSPPLDPWGFFGSSAAGLGDVNGDGIPDLAVGAPEDSAQGLVRGAVYVLYLNADGSVKERWKIASGRNGGPELTNNSRFGTSLAALGDLDGDGIADLAAGSIDGGYYAKVNPFGSIHVLFLTKEAVDFGDAPDTGSGTGRGNYATTAADGGPSHFVRDGLSLGTSVDGDNGLLQNELATADTPDGVVPGDEDGLVNPSVELRLTAGTTPRVNVLVTNKTGAEATLYGWIDYNMDGVFENATERASIVVPAGTDQKIATLTFPTVPLGLSGTTYARIRLSTDSAASNSTGAASDGEVEDYQARITLPSSGVLNRDRTRLLAEGVGGVPMIPQQDGFGRSITSIGDLDGDGIEDFVVGTYAFRSQLQVLLMNRDGSVKHAQPILGYREDFGTSIASLGDLNGDGVTDIAVSDEFYIAVIFLNGDGSEKYRQYQYSGWSSALAGLGDIDGDGIPDLAIGRSGVSDQKGSVQIAFLNSDGTIKSFQVIADGIGGGPSLLPEDFFGSSITSVGDLDGDGISDIAVGSPGDGLTPGQVRDDSYRGAVYALLLTANGTAKSSQKIASGIGGGPILGEYDRFGSSIASMGDLDGDGFPDLAVGAYNHNVNGIRSGGVHLLFLDGDGAAKRAQFIPHDLGGDPILDEYFGFGYALTSIGDLDGDGVAELAVSVPGYDFENGVDGAVYILHLDPVALYGDYNQDNAVDAADYSVWRDQLGSDVEPGSGADGNSDGVVDEQDYQVWKTNFGRSRSVTGDGSFEKLLNAAGASKGSDAGKSLIAAVHFANESIGIGTQFDPMMEGKQRSQTIPLHRSRSHQSSQSIPARHDLALLAWVTSPVEVMARTWVGNDQVDGSKSEDSPFDVPVSAVESVFALLGD